MTNVLIKCTILGFICVFCYVQTRGNQREIDRQRAQKRKEKYGKQGKDDGLTPQQRKERDAAALAAKLAAKQAKKEAEGKK